jgi:hypothetical protein
MKRETIFNLIYNISIIKLFANGIPPLVILGAGEQNYPERKSGSVFRRLRP